MKSVRIAKPHQTIEIQRHDPLADLCKVAHELYRRRMWPQSETLYRYILGKRPNHARALNNLAVLRGTRNDLQEAEALQSKCISLTPDDALLRSNHATTLLDLGRFEEAETEFREALRLEPENKQANFSLGILLLRLGRFAEGWPHYLRRETPDPEAFANKPVSYWKGEDLNGKSLLILDEQGLGEAFQMASFFPELLTTCRSVTLACDPRIDELMRRSFPGIHTVGNKDMELLRAALNDSDHVCFLTHLTAHLAPDAKPQVHPEGCLIPDRHRTRELEAKYRSEFPGKRLIGFSWSTKSTFKQSARTISMDAWHPLLARSDCQFFNLQYGTGSGTVAREAGELGVSVVTDESVNATNDIDGLAAQICALDQVISIDNTTVHLAAALGKPVWTLLMKYPHWLWGLEGNRSAWYPTMRLFRQQTTGDWEPVLQAVNAALDLELQKSGCRPSLPGQVARPELTSRLPESPELHPCPGNSLQP